MIHVGKVGAVAATSTSESAMGYCLVKLLSKGYTLQEDTGGMSEIVCSGTMVVGALYFNRFLCAPFWYMLSCDLTVAKVMYVLQPGLQLMPISSRPHERRL
jgi:hypothetical protein